MAEALYDLVLEERRPLGIAVLLGLMGRIALRRGRPLTARGLAAKALRAARPLSGWYEAGATAVAACSALLLGDSVASVELPPKPKSMRGVAFLYSEHCARTDGQRPRAVIAKVQSPGLRTLRRLPAMSGQLC